ncbi:hypothetical protein PCASD_22512 [Puccinia coronata f. sp. avenae]|uniref:FAD-binding FR-type domain-containing protein n=1 Tax=Puccinia coronata f. sp. avenae TaxID=200324 RepID=A0A2N5S5Z6_9BASI|nr:hypothetical protein PCASD_22512 [Puccinia coronata f. sp. avenae]
MLSAFTSRQTHIRLRLRNSCSFPSPRARLTHTPTEPNAPRRRLLPLAVVGGGGVLSTLGYYYYRRWSTGEEGETLAVDQHRPFPITRTEQLSRDTMVVQLGLSVPELAAAPSGSLYIEAIYLKHPALQIERPYTPLSALSPSAQLPPVPPVDCHHSPTLDLLVKKYPDGDVSTYLHHAAKNLGNRLEIRGPVPTWCHPKGGIDELVFVCDAPIDSLKNSVSLIIPMRRSIRWDPSRDVSSGQPNRTKGGAGLPKFKLIYLARSLDSAYLLDELRGYHSHFPDVFSFKLLVDTPPHPPSALNHSVDKVGRLELSDLTKWLGNSQPETKRIVLVCGPDSLICSVAGCKGRGYNSQGEIGGMLKSLGYSKDQVVKL